MDSFFFGGVYRTAPELMSRGTNFNFARIWADGVWQLATGGAGESFPAQRAYRRAYARCLRRRKAFTERFSSET